MSDRETGTPSLEQPMDAIRAVLDAAGSQRGEFELKGIPARSRYSRWVEGRNHRNHLSAHFRSLGYSLQTMLFTTDSVTLAALPIIGRARGQLASPVDGRYGPLDPDALRPAIELLARKSALAGVQFALGIPEGGCIPAYAFGVEARIQVVLASIWQPDAPGVISFVEEHDLPSVATKHVYGLPAGARVIIVEDEVTSGRTIVNCVRALRAAGMRCDQVATIYAADDPAMRARVAAEGIALHVAMLCQPDTNERLYRR